MPSVTGPDPRRHCRFVLPLAVELGSAGRIQSCETEDISAGGCRLAVLFPLQTADLVRVRLRSDRVPFEASGSATVAWATRDPPYRVGLKFSDPLVEQAGRFLQVLLGPVRLLTGGDG